MSCCVVCAGAMSSFISSPTELLKIRMQLQKAMPGTPGYLGPLGMLQQVVQHEGVLGEHSGRASVGQGWFCMPFHRLVWCSDTAAARGGRR